MAQSYYFNTTTSPECHWYQQSDTVGCPSDPAGFVARGGEGRDQFSVYTGWGRSVPVDITTGGGDDTVAVGGFGARGLIDGGPGEDLLSAAFTGTSDIDADHAWRIDLEAGTATPVNGDASPFAFRNFEDIDQGGYGVAAHGTMTLLGDDGPNRISGTDRATRDSDGYIYPGHYGNDTIDGRGGDDVIRGDGGDDVITGGPGADRIDCGPGDDTVTDAGDDDTITNCEHVQHAGLRAAVEATAADGGPLTAAATQVGKLVRVKVTLSATADAAQPIEHVRADPPLTVTPADGLQPVDGPSPAAPSGATTLSAGQSITYTSTYRIAGTGRATVAVHATGTKDGEPQTADASTVVPLGEPLKVEVAFFQNGRAPAGNAIKLADDDQGEIPQGLDARITVTNVSGVAQERVALADGLDLRTLDPASEHNPFPLEQAGAPAPGRTLGTLEAGASATVTIPLRALRNNDVRVGQLVTSTDRETRVENVSSGSEVLHILPTALLLADLRPDPSTPSFPKTGRTVTLNGSVRNLSSTRPLDLDPVQVRVRGNGGGMAEADGAPTMPDGYTAPFTGVLKPGEKRFFHVVVQTVPNGGTRATAEMAPAGEVVAADGARRALAGEDVRVTAGSSPLVLHLDDSDPPVEASPDAATTAYIFAASALENAQLWFAEGFHGVADWRGLLGTMGGAFVATGSVLAEDAQLFGVAYRNLRAQLMLHVYWSSLNDVQRRQFADEVANDVASAKQAWGAFHASIDQAVLAYFGDFQDRFQKGDTAGAAQVLGAKVGYGIPEAAATLVPEVIMAKVAHGLGWGLRLAGGIKSTAVARAISLGEKIATSGIVLKAAKGLEGVKVGDNLVAKGARVLTEQFGLAANDIKALQFWAKRHNLLIAVRQRSPLSLNWINKYKAVLKPELIKVKNVDEIDVKYLGYLAQDEGSVVLREPLDKKLFQTRTRQLDTATRKAVAKRYATRVKEWKKYEKEYKSWRGKTVDLGFDMEAQGVKKPKKPKKRRFDMERVDVHGRDEYYRVRISDHKGVLRRVTGDIDIVAITTADGRIPPPDVRAKLYEILQEAVGMQHGETLSWILKGELLSSTKATLLADHLPSRELLAVFGPDGAARAAYFDPKLTVFNQATKQGAATFVGAYSTTLEKAGRLAALSLARFF